MIVSFSEILNQSKNYRQAVNSIRTGKYIKVSYGLYRIKDVAYSELELFFHRYKNITLTMQSAFEYYDLTDKNYDKYTIASPTSSRAISDQRIEQLFMSKDLFNIGRVKEDYQGSKIYIYNLERMLIELIRNKNKLPYDYYKEVLKSYRKLVNEDKIDFNLIAKYLKSFKRGDSILNKILELV